MIHTLITAAAAKFISLVVEREVSLRQSQEIDKHIADGYVVGAKVKAIRGRKRGLVGEITRVLHLWFYVKDQDSGNTYRILASNVVKLNE